MGVFWASLLRVIMVYFFLVSCCDGFGLFATRYYP